MNRPDWDEYFFAIAQTVSSRSTCYRNKVGAVIVKDKEIISTGYNGAPSYQKNCLEMGFCYRDKNNILSGTEDINKLANSMENMVKLYKI